VTDTNYDAAGQQPAQLGGLPAAIGRYRKHWPLTLAITCVVFVAVTAFTFLQKPEYSGTATVLLSPKADALGRQSTGAPPVDPTSDAGVDTQVQGLKAKDLAAAVIRSQGLDKDPEFAPAGSKFGNVLDNVSNNLTVKRVSQSLEVEVDFRSANPETAAKVANAFADTYVAQQAAIKAEQAQQLNAMMRGRMDELARQQEAADKAVQDYRAAHGLLSPDQPNANVYSSSLAEDDVRTVGSLLETARSTAAQDQARLTSAENFVKAGNSDGLFASLGTMTMAQLRAQQADASRKVADMQSRYGPKNPDLISAEHQLQDVNRAVQAEVDRVVTGARDQANTSSGQVQALQKTLAAAQAKLLAANEASVHLTELESNAQSAQTIYQTVLSRVKETAAQQATAQADVEVSSRAEPSQKPSYPIVPLNLAVGAILGLVIGGGVAVFREAMNTTLSTLDDVETKLRVPYLASLPLMSTAIKKPTTKVPTDAILQHPLSAFTESFRTLAAAAAPPSLDNPVKTIVVTSSTPDEGKTTAAICMARTSAMGGIRTVLLDCDLRRGAATELLKLPRKKGILDVLTGGATLEDALHHDSASGAYVLPLSAGNQAVEGVLGSEAFDRLLETLKQRFDLIIIDTAPILPVVDTRIVASKCDAVILLVSWRKTPLRAVQTAIHQLEAVGGRVTGVALSQVNLKVQAKSGYGDPAYYYQSYRSYYADQST